jgi:putative ABC transport system permease protein
VEVLEGRRPVVRVPIAGVVEVFAGLGAWMEIGALHRVLREGDLASGALLAVDPKRRDLVYRSLKEIPRVATVTVKAAAVQAYRETMSETILRMRLINVLFACVIAAGVVYNAGRVALAERSRDLASLRVLGFTRGEISTLLLGEIAVLTVAGLPVGLLLGRALARFTLDAMQTETFRLPAVISAATYATAVTVVLLASALTALVLRRRLDHLDLVAVLKSRE